MDKIGIIFDVYSNHINHLTTVIKKKYEVVEVFSFENMKKILTKSFDKFALIIVDNPSKKTGFDDFVNFVNKRNSYMFSLPILIATNEETMDEDSKLLRGPVLDVIFDQDCEEIIFSRINNAIRLSNSTNFDDFSNMLKVLPSLIYLKDRRGRYAFSSQHWHHLVTESIRGKTDYEIRKDKENARRAREADFEVVKTGKGKNYIIKEDDEEGVDYLQVIKEPLKNENGDVYGIIAIVNNVTNEELLKQQLREKSITDQLTGLYNRSYFDELTHWKGGKLDYPLTIISADCDGLKGINDEFGHSAGDQYICYAKDALKQALPADAFLFRMGGDEFLAILPDTDEEKADQIVEEINEMVKQFKNKDFVLKLSVGSYTVSCPDDSIETAIKLSDKEMYRIKKEHKANSK